MGAIWTIYRKELVDTLRDRKTLIFMLLLPTLAMPLLMFGVSRYFQAVQKAEEVRPVVVVADAATQDAYRRMVHEWFMRSELGTGFKILDAPVLRALLKPDQQEQARAIPPGVSTDPAVFETWVRGLAKQSRDNIDSIDERASATMKQLPDNMQQNVVDFYQVAIKGYALVTFVEPDKLAPAPPGFQIAHTAPGLEKIDRLRDIAWGINTRAVQGYLEIPPAVGTLLEKDETRAEILLLHDSTTPLSGEARDRVSTVVDRAGREIVRARLKARNISPDFLEPLGMRQPSDLASPTKRALAAVGTILPYLVIVFAFLGGMYPAIDLGAGEKERNTLETLLLSPSSRTQIALGKFLVILTASLTASLLGVVSMAVSYQTLLPKALLDILQVRIDARQVALIAMLVVPAAASFAGIFLAISIYARSFKEAQSYMAPLQFVLIFPALAPMTPGLEMSWKIALIPLVNVSMLARDFLKGDTNWGFYGLTLLSSALVAAACVAFCVRQFNRESVLFRT